jgi:phage FluMu protein Com
MSNGNHHLIPWEEWSCSNCHTLLMRVIPAPGMHISIKCRRCGAIIERKIESAFVPTTDDGSLKHLLHRIEDRLAQLT